MPTYEYHCDKCGTDFEEFQKMTDPPLNDCPICKSEHCVHRLISGGAGLIFKGSGFYITDYRSSDYKKAAEAEKNSVSSSTSSKKSETKTEKKESKAKTPAKA